MKYKVNLIMYFWISIAVMIILNSCNPKIYIPKQNVSTIAGETKNTELDDIAPAQEKTMECINLANDSIQKSKKVMPSSKYVRSLFDSEVKSTDHIRSQVIENMTRNVESLYFTDENSGFAALSHPPIPEFLMGENLPFEKEVQAGGTDIFYFGKNNEGLTRFKSFAKLNSPYWDSHPTAVTQTNSKNQCVTLLIFSSDRDNPYSKAITIKGDTIYAGSTDLYYTFGKFNPDTKNSPSDIISYDFTEVRKLIGANTDEFNEGSPFVYCQCCNPTLFYSSNRHNKNSRDFDLYAVKLGIDFDNLTLSVTDKPELVDIKSVTTDSLTNSINTIADERFPFIPFPHKENGNENNIYFSSDRNKKPVPMPCNCERGNDRTENYGGYDMYKFALPDRFNCPTRTEPDKKVIYSPELYAEVVLIDALNPENPVRNPQIKIMTESGNEILSTIDSNRLYLKLDFDKKYFAYGGSSYNNADCNSGNDVIFRGYYAPEEVIYQKSQDSATRIEVLTSFTMDAPKFLKYKKDSVRYENSNIFVKSIELDAIDRISEKVTNARIVDDIVFYDKLLTYTKFWDKIDIRPEFKLQNFETSFQKALLGNTKSVLTMNENFYSRQPESNEVIILKDTIYIMPDYIIKPPCYCEFTGMLTNYQQNVPYFQTGFWEVNSLSNYKRDIQRLNSGKFADARWIELHEDNQYFGEGKNGRLARFAEYESYARSVDTNISIMADVIVNNIIPAFKVIDSISPNGKLVISLDAWSDRRPVRRGWYIGDEVSYIEGSLIEGNLGFDINFHKVRIPDRSSLNMNNDTLSRLRAYYGYRELLAKLLDTAKIGRGFYDYFVNGDVLLPDDSKLLASNINSQFSINSAEEFIKKSKIIILSKGNYFDPTEFKVPKYIKNVDSSLFMLDTIRRIDVRINTLEYQSGKLIKSSCCNELLPCVDYREQFNLQRLSPVTTNNTRIKKKTKK